MSAPALLPTSRRCRQVTLHEQWEALVGKVGGKVFCLLGDTSGDIVFKVSEIAFDGLVELEGIGRAAYFAKRQWVRVTRTRSRPAFGGLYRRVAPLIAAKLTRKAQSRAWIVIVHALTCALRPP